MKLDGRQLRALILTIAAFVISMLMLRGQQFPLLTLTNAIPTNSPQVTNDESDSKTNETVIEVRDVPMSRVIESLARQAGINYLIDVRLAKWWSMPDIDGGTSHEPTVSFRWKNLTPKQTLLYLLNNYKLVLLEDPYTSIARITYTNQVVNPIDISFLGSETNISDTNGIVIQFQDIPITSALNNFARLAGINYTLDPKISYGLPDKHGQTRVEPLLTLRWQNVSVKQGLIALCENYDLVIVKDAVTGVVRIKPKD